ncbi:DUF222 domain-containing protein [Candidatus Poriferisodalis sp.]|uniref:HNH endonuclease n=1 Tax=Candidatus Poriferisodalis sp. TaxID=3101277 RepID=UPI003B01A42A
MDVPALDADGLRLRLAQIGHARSQLAAAEASALCEIARCEGETVAAHTAANVLSVSVRAARDNVKTAAALAKLDVTREGLAAGSVPAGHAQIIARAASDTPINEGFLVEIAQRQGLDEFRRTVARHVADCTDDDGASLLERQRQQRSARVFTSRETGMTVVNGQFDPIVGARITAVVNAAVSRLFHDEDPKCRSTPAQRTADAVAKLRCEPDTSRPAGTSLVLVADYDVLNQQIANARLANGTTVPISEIAKVAVDADILPMIFNKATGDLRMGRRRRSASELQRSALAVRDQGCVGCGASPELCRAHHIVEWQHGGNTDLDNLVSVCHHCHHNSIHQQGFTVEHNAVTGRYQLHAPGKLPVGAAPATGPPAGELNWAGQSSSDLLRNTRLGQASAAPLSSASPKRSTAQAGGPAVTSSRAPP